MDPRLYVRHMAKDDSISLLPSSLPHYPVLRLSLCHLSEGWDPLLPILLLFSTSGSPTLTKYRAEDDNSPYCQIPKRNTCHPRLDLGSSIVNVICTL